MEVVTDGFRAVEVAARTQPAIVVAEIGLEGLSGTDLVRRLLAIVPETSVICWTNVSSPVAGRADAALGRLRVPAEGGRPRRRAPRDPRGDRRQRRPQPPSRRPARRSPRGRVDPAARPRDRARRGLGAARVAHDRQGRLPREHLARAPDAGHGRQGHRVRPQEPRAARGGAAGVPRPARVLPREAHDAHRRDADDRRPGPRHAHAEAHRGRPRRRSSPTSPTRSRASTRSVEIRRDVPDRLVGARRPRPDRRGRPAAARQRVPLLARRTVRGAQGRARCPRASWSRSPTAGQGIRRDVVAKAFNEPFTAGEDILRKERAGAGVGLHMARQIVLQHGGIMWADPAPGGGHASLVRHPGPRRPDAHRAASAGRARGTRGRRGRARPRGRPSRTPVAPWCPSLSGRGPGPPRSGRPRSPRGRARTTDRSPRRR